MEPVSLVQVGQGISLAGEVSLTGEAPITLLYFGMVSSQ
jgi:hypothetical protein